MSKEIDAYKLSDDLKYSHWRIKVPVNDTVSRDDYEKLQKENAELRTKLDSIKKLIN